MTKLKQMQEKVKKYTCLVDSDPEGNLTYEITSNDINSLITEVWNEAEQNGVQIGRDMMGEEMKEKMKFVFGLELWQLHKKYFTTPAETKHYKR